MEIVDYQRLDRQYFVDALSGVTERLAGYGIHITYGVLPPTAAAQFDGPTVILADQLSPEAALFTLLHIFGHVVQQNSDGLLLDASATSTEEVEWLTLKLSEQEASEYGLALLHELGYDQLDQWLSDIWHWDWQYMESVYLRGTQSRPTLAYNYAEIPFGQTRLRPRQIPKFTVKKLPTKTVI